MKKYKFDFENIVFELFPCLMLFFICDYLFAHGHFIIAVLQGICWVIFCYKNIGDEKTEEDLRTLENRLKSAAYDYYFKFYGMTYDDFYKADPYNHKHIDEAITLIYDGIKFRLLVKKRIEDIPNISSDNSYDISGFKEFISLQKEMSKKPEEYINKSVYIEGYIFSLDSFDCKSEISLSPIPCKTEFDRSIFYEARSLGLTDLISVYSDYGFPEERGLHLRIYGIPYFSEYSMNVKIFAQKYEIIE